jgi:hypothetical protein
VELLLQHCILCDIVNLVVPLDSSPLIPLRGQLPATRAAIWAVFLHAAHRGFAIPTRHSSLEVERRGIAI